MRLHLIGEELRTALKHWQEQAASDDPRGPMQDEAVRLAVEGLNSVRGAKHDGWRGDDARGNVVMPCGTGKTRVGYRIAAEICSKATGAATPLTVVLAPSIGLIRQLRAQWIVLAGQHGDRLRTLSVCSDPPIGGTKQESLLAEQSAVRDEALVGDDPTTDLSGLSAVNLVGETKKSGPGVADWLKTNDNAGDGVRLVVFSTYQSSHHTGQGMRSAGVEAEVLIADEAHRTAGLKGSGKRNADQIRDFTVCHRNDAMPARNRVYMTATPRAFARGTGRENSKYEVLSMDDERIFGCELFRLPYAEAVSKEFLSDYRIIAVAPPASSRDIAKGMALRAKDRAEAKLGRGTRRRRGRPRAVGGKRWP